MTTRESYTLDVGMTPTTDKGVWTRHLLLVAFVMGSTPGWQTSDVHFTVTSYYSNLY